MPKTPILVLLTVLSVGCLAVNPVEFPPDHPANAQARQAHEAKPPSALEKYSLPTPKHPLADQPMSDKPVVDAMESMGTHDHSASNAYTCPMHPEVQSDTEGQCPICEMRLVPRVDANAEKES